MSRGEPPHRRAEDGRGALGVGKRDPLRKELAEEQHRRRLMARVAEAIPKPSRPRRYGRPAWRTRRRKPVRPSTRRAPTPAVMHVSVSQNCTRPRKRPGCSGDRERRAGRPRCRPRPCGPAWRVRAETNAVSAAVRIPFATNEEPQDQQLVGGSRHGIPPLWEFLPALQSSTPRRPDAQNVWHSRPSTHRVTACSTSGISGRPSPTPEGGRAEVVHIPRFSLAAGEQRALRGESGCGKTTFLNLVSGILAADSGSIEVGGTDMAALPSPRATGCARRSSATSSRPSTCSRASRSSRTWSSG
jgi:hypothetical protein